MAASRTLPEALLSPWSEATEEGRCVMSGTDESGVLYESDCTEAGCTLRIDGLEICDCDEVDFANTCSNGVPSCTGWLIFDWSEGDR